MAANSTQQRYSETHATAGEHGWAVIDRHYPGKRSWPVMVDGTGQAINIHEPSERTWAEMTQRDAHDLAMELNG